MPAVSGRIMLPYAPHGSKVSATHFRVLPDALSRRGVAPAEWSALVTELEELTARYAWTPCAMLLAFLCCCVGLVP
jgi:hypothetical protein